MSIDKNNFKFDAVIVGGGHAGVEAALACAKNNLKCALVTLSIDSIALMPCNPNVGGTSKGHLVCELDALGGEMGKAIDKTYLQSKLLNRSKGPAVHSLRAQADKKAYAQYMRDVLEANENITLIQGEIVDIITEDNNVVGAKLNYGLVLETKTIVICTGTYLKSRCICGEAITESGPNGLMNSRYLSSALLKLGLKLKRFKTGTPARIDKSTIDFTKMKLEPGDDEPTPFSFTTDRFSMTKEQLPCYLTYTNEETHNIIRDNFHRAPLFSGVIEGAGPRYCPSIEDKVNRFADRDRHQVFIEPEGLYTTEMYIDGMSTSLPYDVQIAMYRSVAGLENAKIVRPGYAIEYDCLDSNELLPSLETKKIHGLFCAGQINGSSGYEEAAAQGLIAGINASNYCLEREPLILDRSSSYIGVLIDDLVTKEITEPYRMMTSRAEYRLLLRQDNADERLTRLGYENGLISEERYNSFIKKYENVAKEIERVKGVIIKPTKEVNELLSSLNTNIISNGIYLSELIKRPELSYEELEAIDNNRPKLSYEEARAVDINIKYEGYIARQERQVAAFKKLERRKLPEDIDYSVVPSLSNEARQKLELHRPINLGMAGRIAGVNPADITVLTIYLKSIGR